jgi:acyl transferase domain-containing protein/thioesterase domain-containing protein/acyl carrier protein
MKNKEATMQYTTHQIYVCHRATVPFAALAASFSEADCHDFSAESEEDAAATFEYLSLALLEQTQRALRGTPAAAPLLQVVVSERQFALRSGIAGLFRSIAREHPSFRGQVIAVNEAESAASLVEKLRGNAAAADRHVELLYRGEQRLAPDWQEHILEGASSAPWRKGEVYLISGGLGGLARLMLEDIRACGLNNRVILVGRSSVDDAIRQQLEDWARGGVLVSYRRADIADTAQVEDLVAWIIDQCGRLDGVIHCAGLIRDNLLLNKGAAEFEQVLQPKVRGALNLDQATRRLPLRFFALFSSLSSVLGNAGQADYATGNGFMDGYARQRAQRVRAGEGSGRSVSINWPYWQDGGMRMDPRQVERMWRDSGLRALPTEAGMQAFYRALALDEEQLLVVGGDGRRIRQVAAELGGGRVEAPSAPARKLPLPAADAGASAASMLQRLTRLVAAELSLAEPRIKRDAPLSKYGIDSVMMMKVIAKLEEDFGSLPKTLFFEYQTLDELTAYFVNEHASGLARLEGEREAEMAREPAPRSPSSPSDLQRPAVAADIPSPASGAQASLIAIVAMAGRYPGADSVEAFWQRLAEGYDGIGGIPAQRWDADAFYEQQPAWGKSPCRWGGFLEDVDAFDPEFFKLTPKEASIIAPEARLLLQTVQHLFDSAGLTRQAIAERYQSRLGVFVGAMYQQYGAFESDTLSESLVSISSYSSIANRISHFFDLHGPSLALDTMCSSSLVALHYAWESLLRGECAGAVVAGVNLSLHPKKYIGLSAGNMLADSADSRSFSEGSGYLPSEAAGAVLLRPLADALRDKDHILGIIRSSHVSHSGGVGPYATPNVKAQAALIQENLDKAGIAANSISYIEAAANGAAISDAVEMRALSKVFAGADAACAIGSVKSNIGHAEAASGMSQLTKVLLQLKHRKWTPTPGISRMNPDIDWPQLPFALQTQLCDWPQPELSEAGRTRALPRRAAIDSFGAGGTYAHLIIEEYPEPARSSGRGAIDGGEQLIALSANSAASLRALAAAHAQASAGGESLAEYARALRSQRDPMAYRLALVATDFAEMKARLRVFAEQGDAAAIGAFAGCSETPEDGDAQRIDEAMRQLQWATLAESWARGVEMDWRRLDGAEPEPPLALPLYPFERQPCWLAPRSAPRGGDASGEAMADQEARPGLESVVAALCEATGLPPGTWDSERALGDYNLGSATFMLFFQRLKQRAGALALSELRECRTLSDVAHLLSEQATAAVPPEPLTPSSRRYPELVALNHGRGGRPVFWIHAGIGGVEAYQALAEQVERPFYGIQARGYMSEREPLQGLQAMAAYYCHLILAKQPNGPYSLGGYSLGGALAYEVTRQLQELGETVDSLVMVDSLDDQAMSGAAVSTKTLYLQSANIAIGASFGGDMEQALAQMIHQDQIDSEVSDEVFLQDLSARICRVSQDVSAQALAERIRRNAEVQGAYDGGQFKIRPLPRPESVRCLYLHNRGGNYFGLLQPYLFVRGERSDLGQTDYARGWLKQMPNAELIEVDALCHMLMLSTQPSFGQIISHCQRLYADTAPRTGKRNARSLMEA